MKTLADDECHKVIGVDPGDFGSLCAYSGKNGTGACFGDSGGPLIYKNELIGITSWVFEGKCAQGYPDAFTRLSEHVDWIEANIKTHT